MKIPKHPITDFVMAIPVLVLVCSAVGMWVFILVAQPWFLLPMVLCAWGFLAAYYFAYRDE